MQRLRCWAVRRCAGAAVGDVLRSVWRWYFQWRGRELVFELHVCARLRVWCGLELQRRVSVCRERVQYWWHFFVSAVHGGVLLSVSDDRTAVVSVWLLLSEWQHGRHRATVPIRVLLRCRQCVRHGCTVRVRCSGIDVV